MDFRLLQSSNALAPRSVTVEGIVTDFNPWLPSKGGLCGACGACERAVHEDHHSFRIAEYHGHARRRDGGIEACKEISKRKPK